MLVGSRSREVLDARLDELSTYGMLKSVGTASVQPLFREMEKAGLVETQTPEDYPLLRPHRQGHEAMRKGGPVRLVWPEPGFLECRRPCHNALSPICREGGGRFLARTGLR